MCMVSYACTKWPTICWQCLQALQGHPLNMHKTMRNFMVTPSTPSHEYTQLVTSTELLTAVKLRQNVHI